MLRQSAALRIGTSFRAIEKDKSASQRSFENGFAQTPKKKFRRLCRRNLV
jgi:hypothetical protein